LFFKKIKLFFKVLRISLKTKTSSLVFVSKLKVFFPDNFEKDAILCAKLWKILKKTIRFNPPALKFWRTSL